LQRCSPFSFSAGLSPGYHQRRKLLARAAFLLAQIATPQTTNPAHGRVWLLVLIEDHPASVTA
jgi:hypothetical protein